jgi:hypothetical protein
MSSRQRIFQQQGQNPGEALIFSLAPTRAGTTRWLHAAAVRSVRSTARPAGSTGGGPAGRELGVEADRGGAYKQELNRAQIGFRKADNAFLAVDDVTALQEAADRLSPDIIRKRLDYWTLILGPKFSAKERTRLNLSRFYAIAQIEYCRNFIFKRHFPIHKLFERSCELGLWRLTGDKIAAIFGTRVNRRM